MSFAHALQRRRLRKLLKQDDIPREVRDYLSSASPQKTLKFPWQADRFVVLDTETTGLNPKQDQVLSIGAVLVEERSIQLGEVLELTLQNPQASTSSIPIHGILPSESAAGIPPEEASRKLLRFIGNSPLVGHHLAFDLRMLQKLLATHCPGFFFHNRCLDTAQLARRLEKPFVSQDMIRGTDYSLDELIKRYGLVAHDRHTALGDAFITAQLFLKLLSRGGQAGWRRI